MKVLARGQKVRLEELSASLRGRVQLRAVASGLKIEFSCFGVDEEGVLADGRYFIFSGQAASPEGALKMGIGQRDLSQSFDFELARLPPAIRRLAFVISIEGAGEMRQIESGHFLLSLGGRQAARFSFSSADFSSEKALIAGEVYFKDRWRVTAVGQGFSGGLPDVLKYFGGEPGASTSSPPRTLPSTSTTSTPPTAPDWRALSEALFALPTFWPRSAKPNTCARCGRGVGFLERMRGGFNEQARRCQKCEESVAIALSSLRFEFSQACASGISPENWRVMWERFGPTSQGVPPAQALEFLGADSLRHVDRLLAIALAQRGVSVEEERRINILLHALAIPPAHAERVRGQIALAKEMARLREGHLPTVESGHHLESGEMCHLDVPATYHKVLARSSSLVAGRLVATSKKLVFLAPGSGRTVRYKNIMRVEKGIERGVNWLGLHLSVASGAGRYDVVGARDFVVAEAVISTLSKMAKTQAVAGGGQSVTRRIAPEVKLAVWQRERGACAVCGSDEGLQLDPISPPAKNSKNSKSSKSSKSARAAITVENVRLMCRACSENHEKISGI